MIRSSYLVRESAPPSDLKRFFDQRIMPATIDVAAFLDISLARTAGQMRRNPVMALGLAIGLGVLLAAWRRPRANSEGVSTRLSAIMR